MDHDGRRHGLQVPDTLDLAEHGRMAVNGLTGTLNPDLDFECTFRTIFDVHPRVSYIFGPDEPDARAVADRWTKSAAAIVDVPEETVLNSAAMYLAEKAVLKIASGSSQRNRG